MNLVDGRSRSAHLENAALMCRQFIGETTVGVNGSRAPSRVFADQQSTRSTKSLTIVSTLNG